MGAPQQPGVPPASQQPPAPVQPAAQPVPPSGPAVPPPDPVRHHVHHSYIWLESLRTLVIVGLVLVVGNFSTIAGVVADGGLGGFPAGIALALVAGGTLVLILVVFGIVAVTRVVGYKHLYFTVGPYEFTLYSGIFNKKQAHVPYQRVQSVDQRATLLQRIFGVCTVSIDTAGGAANSAVIVPYLTKQQAEWLRTELYERKASLARLDAFHAAEAAAKAEGRPFPPATAGASDVPAAPGISAAAAAPAPGVPVAAPATAPGNVLDIGAAAWDEVGGVFAGGAVDTGRVTFEYGLTNKELFLTGLSGTTSAGLILAGLIVGVLQLVGTAFDLFGNAANTVVEGAVSYVASEATGYVAGIVAVAVIVVVLVLWLLSAVGTCISYGGFKARRRAGRIEVEYGLLQHTFQGIDVDRVQSVVVKQSFIRRLFGYCELSLGKIDAVQGEEAQKQQSTLAQQGVIVHPFVKMSRVPEILAGLIPEFADLPCESKPVAKVALRRALVRRCIIQGGGFWLALLAAAGIVLINGLVGAADAGTLVFDDYDDAVMLGLAYTYGRGVLVALIALAAVLLVIDAVGAVLWARESSFAYNRRFMQVSNGGLSRTTVSFPRQKIQFACARSNPLQRRAGTRTLLATTAAGTGGTTTSLIDVGVEDAAAWLDWMKPGGNR
ncbi:PH domain-containing protein [uncultured Adlercreutzia sp.]|uniref:PH domain-containing protein n=1 Tax=uncultured Adlercreutzia sp. TaxID=875803 RepID=UPI0026750513|nr:PH domain-containing protein [uncultured Adlercreutzia sp.]